MKYSSLRIVSALAAFAAMSLALAPTPARAIVTSGGSDGFGLYVNLEVLSVPVLTIPNTPHVIGTAPGAYNFDDTVLSVGVSVPLIGSVGTGVLNASVLSDIDGGAGNRFSYGDALVDDLSISLVPTLTAGPVLTLTADTIGSGTFATGDFGAMSTLGDTVLENLAITVAGVPLNIPVSPAPNTVLFDALGIRIVLNEQFGSTTATDASLDTNAIHIDLTDVAGLGGLISGEVIIAHSSANMTSAVPEPGTFVAIASGLGLLAIARRRRR